MIKTQKNKRMSADFGYCCINLTLDKTGVKIGRGMIKRTFEAKGIKYASELAEANLTDMIKILEWNYAQGITMYRMSSSMFPWSSEYDLSDLPNYEAIKILLKRAGDYAKKTSQRLTFHPGPFNVLASPTQKVVDSAIQELSQHGNVMDLMGLPRTHYAAMNIHVGGSYGDKASAIQRFAKNFKLLPVNVTSRLVLENDDKPSQYGVKDLYEIYELCGTPITFDYHHHFCYDDVISEEEGLKLASLTWPNGIRQLCHYSSSKQLYEDTTSILRAHADYLYDHIETYGMSLDIEIEAKAKELALIKYHKQFISDSKW
jgi:UV DNA damage endonuclease